MSLWVIGSSYLSSTRSSRRKFPYGSIIDNRIDYRHRFRCYLSSRFRVVVIIVGSSSSSSNPRRRRRIVAVESPSSPWNRRRRRGIAVVVSLSLNLIQIDRGLQSSSMNPGHDSVLHLRLLFTAAKPPPSVPNISSTYRELALLMCSLWDGIRFIVLCHTSS